MSSKCSFYSCVFSHSENSHNFSKQQVKFLKDVPKPVVLNTPLRDHLSRVWWKKHEKTFVEKLPIPCSLSSPLILRLPPHGCSGEHTLHYLDGQSLSNPYVFSPEKEQAKNRNFLISGLHQWNLQVWSRPPVWVSRRLWLRLRGKFLCSEAGGWFLSAP